MNKTFKVVFNRARGALMVANEITSSVQKKGTKIVLATALLSVLGASAYAEGNTQYSDGSFTFEEDTTISTTTASGESNNRCSGIAATDSGKITTVTVADGKTLTINGKLEDIPSADRIYLISAQQGSKVTVNGNVTGTISTDSSSASIRGIRSLGGEITIDGDLSATVKGNGEETSGVDTWDGTKLVITGSKANITVTTAGDIFGVTAQDGGTLDFNSSDTTISVDNSSGTSSLAKGVYSHKVTTSFGGNTTVTVKGNKYVTYGVNVECDPGNEYPSIINFSGDTTLIDVSSTGGTVYGMQPSGGGPGEINFTGKTVTVKAQSKSGTVYAIESQYSGLINFDADAIVYATTEGTGDAYGVLVTNYTSSAGNATFNKSLTVTATTKDANAYGIYSDAKAGGSSSNGVLSVAGKTTVNATSTAKNAYGVTADGNVKTIELADADIRATSEAGVAVGVLAKNGGTVHVGSEGKTTSISVTGAKGTDTNTLFATEGANLTIEGETISLSSNLDVVESKTGATITIGTDKTKAISITAGDTGIFAGNKGHVVVNGKKLEVTSTGYYGILAQNGSEDNSAPEGAASVAINTEETTVVSEAYSGLMAFSNGQLTVNSNITVTAPNAIDVRGNSTMNVNTDGKHTTKLDGDIVFETPNSPGDSQNSGKIINANVNVVLSGEESYWNGRSYQEYKINGKYEQLVGLEGDASYHGNVTGFNLTVADGAKWTLSGDGFVNTLTLKDGGKIDASKATTLNVGKWDASANVAVSDFTVRGTGNELILGSETTLSGEIVLVEGSELITPLATAFTTVTEDAVVTGATKRLTVTLVKDATSATLTIPDDFKLTTAALTSMNEQYSAVTLNLANVTVLTNASASGGENTSEIKTDVITQSLTGKGDVKIDSGKTLTVSGENKTSEVGTIDLGEVTTEGTAAGTLKVANQTKVNVSEVKGEGVVLVTDKSELAVETLSGASTISVGERDGNGATLSVKTLKMTGGAIFVDPLYGHSTFHVESLGSGTLNTNITAGSGGLVVFGEATQEEVTSAMNKISALSEASAVVYTKKAAKLGSSGSVVIDPSAEAAVETYAQKVVIRNGGTLVIDQKALAGGTVFEDAQSIVLETEANFGVVNAAVGTIYLGADVTDEGASAGTPATVSVYTDSPFLRASLASDGVITIASEADEEGLSAIASMGIQSMIRHADAVLAETIADRTATRESGLWVSVRGERYEQDDVGSGFTADVGYGAFGADFAPTDATRLGLAIQYGHGKVKGNAFSVKNKFKDYSATLYGSADFGDTGIKLLGEVAYTQSKNDITNTYYTGLNQELDAKMYSGGVTLQKGFEVGSVNITPSIGVRVSRIETEAMTAGTITIAKQKETLVQVPVALRLSTKPVETASGWSITPRFKVAYIPTFGDKEIEVLGAKTTVLDTSPVQGAFGITFKKGGFAADVAAKCGVGNRGTSSIGGKVGMSYQF